MELRTYKSDSSFLEKIDLDVGKSTDFNKKTFACPFDGCNSVFDRPYRLAQHRLVHVNVKPFTCDELNCEKAYTSKSHLDRHIKSAHKETEVDILYCCPKCLKKYANRQNLKRHIKVSHIDNNKPFCCALCRLYFKKKHQLKAHMFIHNGVKPFRCPMCDRDFVTLYEKKKHMRNHKVYKCEHCDTKFTRWTELMHHKRVDHVSPEYICHDCGKVFKERGHIIRHVKKHMPNTPVTIFFCPYDNCVRHYSRNSNLKQHILVKHEGYTFDCSLCGAKLSTKAKLNEHIDRHNRPKLPAKVHKTLETGRKKRKDAGTIRYETAMRLAGIVKQKIQEGISRLCTDNRNNEENIQSDEADTNPGNENENFQKQDNVTNILGRKTVFPNLNSMATDPNQRIIVKLEDINSNETTESQNEVENTKTMFENPTISEHINKGVSSRMKQMIEFQQKVINKPSSLIEILNRPAIRINSSQDANNCNDLNKAFDIQIKIEPDNDNGNIVYQNNTDTSKVQNESIDNLHTSNKPMTDIFIKNEQHTEEQNINEQYNINNQGDVNESADFHSTIQNGSLSLQNTPSNPIDNALSSLFQLYWKTVMNNQNV